MKRKLVKQGRNALTVTLPAEWSRANKLAAGDEVEVLQEGRNIMITPEEVKEAELKVEYDITGLDRSSIVLLYTSLYESGVDEVRFRFSKDSTTDHKTGSKAAFSDIITAYTLRFEGFAVVEQGKGYYIIKDISNQSEKDFDAVLRRVFLLLLNFHEQMIEGLETNQPLTSKKADELHDNITLFVSFCVRLLNKRIAPAIEKYSLHHIIKGLDQIADYDKWVVNRISKGTEPGKQFRDYAKLSTDMFRAFYEFFYTPDDKRLTGIVKAWYEQEARFSRRVSADDLQLMMLYRGVPAQVSYLLRSVLTLRNLNALE